LFRPWLQPVAAASLLTADEVCESKAGVCTTRGMELLATGTSVCGSLWT